MRAVSRPGVQAAIAFALLAAIFGFSYLSGTGAIMASSGGRAGQLAAFGSEEELRLFLRKLRERREKEAVELKTFSNADLEMGAGQASVTDAAPPSDAADPSGITNVQEAGVDEGGIVKVRGDMLVILRRGRLFTVSVAGGAMRAIDMIDAFPPGAASGNDGYGEWYDEMLLFGDRVIVVGYSYSRGGTEINRFRLDSAGNLTFEDSYHLRSNDYYSSRNYASRLIADRLIFYTPLYFGWDKDPLESLPALRRWRGNAADKGFKPIAGARDIYIPPRMRDDEEAPIDTLHSVVTCDLGSDEMDCSAVGVLGPGSRSFYVSGEAVYLWLSEFLPSERGAETRASHIYRLPLTGGRPSAVRARGAPTDQFSFRADEEEGTLHVLLRSEGGDAMFGPEVGEGGVMLLSAPLDEFGDGSRALADRHYRRLPSPRGESWWFHNRFVGDHVLYGAGAFGEEVERSKPILYATPLDSGRTAELPLPNSVDRIEVLGRDAMVVGAAAGGLGFTTIELSSTAPSVGDHYIHPMASEGESRSHAFFYRPDPAAPAGDSGMLGLPVARAADPAFRRFFGSSAAIAFLRRIDRRLSPAGELSARSEGIADDGCKASCVDWYGNARPIFLGQRTFALLGYELVEGRLAGGWISEVARLSFAPRGADRPPKG